MNEAIDATFPERAPPTHEERRAVAEYDRRVRLLIDRVFAERGTAAETDRRE